MRARGLFGVIWAFFFGDECRCCVLTRDPRCGSGLCVRCCTERCKRECFGRVDADVFDNVRHLPAHKEGVYR